MNTGEHGHDQGPAQKLSAYGAQAWEEARRAWLDGSLTADVQNADSCDGPSDASDLVDAPANNAEVPDELRTWLNTHRRFPRSVPLNAMVTYLIDQWTFDDVPKDTIKVLDAGKKRHEIVIKAPV